MQYQRRRDIDGVDGVAAKRAPARQPDTATVPFRSPAAESSTLSATLALANTKSCSRGSSSAQPATPSAGVSAEAAAAGPTRSHGQAAPVKRRICMPKNRDIISGLWAVTDPDTRSFFYRWRQAPGGDTFEGLQVGVGPISGGRIFADRRVEWSIGDLRWCGHVDATGWLIRGR